MAMDIMARLALLLISLFLACQPMSNHHNLVFHRAKVSVKTAKGLCYVNGNVFSGTLFETAPTGDTLSLETYRNGKEHGEWKQFYDRGKKKSIRHFVNGKKHGAYREWWPDGSRKQEYEFKDGEYDGVLKEWEASGQLLRESTYLQGHEEGAQKAWYPNGKIRSNYVIIEGRRFGLLGTKNCLNVADSVLAGL